MYVSTKIQKFIDAEELRVSGRLDQALKLYMEILEEDPVFYPALEKIGDVYMDDESPNRALEYYFKACKGFKEEGSDTRAANVLKKMIKIDPRSTTRFLKEARRLLHDIESDTLKVIPSGMVSELVSRPAFLKDLNEEQFAAMVKRMDAVEVKKGKYLFKDGDEGDSIYFVFKGVAAIVTNDKKGQELELARFTRGDFFGEYGFFTGGKRSASVKALTDLVVFELTKSSVDALLRDKPEITKILYQFYKYRVLDIALARSRLFYDLTPEERKKIINSFQFIRAKKNDLIIQEGKESDELYLIKSGEVKVFTRDPKSKKPILLAILGPHDFFGEIAFITNQSRSASVVVSKDSELLRIEKRKMEDIIYQFPQISKRLQSVFKERNYHKSSVNTKQNP